MCPPRPEDRDGMCLANFTNPVRLGLVEDLPDTIVFAQSISSYPPQMSTPKGLNTGGPPMTASQEFENSLSATTQEPGSWQLPTLPNTPTATTTTTVAPDDIPLSSAKSPTLPLGAAMGIGATIVVVVIAALVAMYFLWKRGIRNGRSGPAPPQPVEMATDCEALPPVELDAGYEMLAMHEIEGHGIHELATGTNKTKVG